jgi:hypothetical protein
MAHAPELEAHLEWLGYLQPVGLVVSAPALVAGQAFVDRNIVPVQQRLTGLLREEVPPGGGESEPVVRDLPAVLREVFGWEPGDLLGGPGAAPVPAELEVALPDYHETLRPTYAVPEFSREPNGKPAWLLLIEELPPASPLDEVRPAGGKGWEASPQARFERLLRELQVPTGLLVNGTHLRLVYAPRGETSGHVTFPVRAMTEVAGRPILAALHMLLRAERLFVLPPEQRLPAILAQSRKFQALVSTRLAGQVLAALYELLRGFQAADDQRRGELLRAVLAADPDRIYAGLLTVLLRLVFLLYAEDRGLMSADPVYVNHYSVTALFEQLRADAGRYPDTMDQRYGAWARLLTLFRLVYRGGSHGALRLPARRGYLFDPDRYPFLEGVGSGESGVGNRSPGTADSTPYSPLPIPLVSDGVVFRVLENLLVLDGERLAYRSLDVEQIGSVYETMMGFRLEKARGRAIAVKPVKAHGAPVTIDLDALLGVAGKDRGKWLKEQSDQSVTGAALNALKAADTPEAVVAALERKVARDLTPNVVPPGAMVLQPSDERRRSGSHYTPRSLTAPIVRKALEPIVGPVSNRPASEQADAILSLKVCDPAMGSGAFLVEACRQLADALLRAWSVQGKMPRIPDDETPELYAQRLIAQRCLYGVDRNPMAVDLAKLSLWLATLAKDHPFTFVDHALRCGDSLVGLGRGQIGRFHWKETPQQGVFGQEEIAERIGAATDARQRILDAGDFMSPLEKAQNLALADDALNPVRFAGNLVVAAFFAADNERRRQVKRDEVRTQYTEFLRTKDFALWPKATEKALREEPKGISPFHWEVEFPEVFGREDPGFDCIVGNPPFAGKNTIIDGHADGYLDWLKCVHPESHGNADLVAHFYRRAFDLLRPGGTFGLIATNTIAQGDTRTTGLRWICTHGGTIYAARRRYKWPGQAAVVVSVVHIAKQSRDPVGAGIAPPYALDGKEVPLITAYLFHAGGHENPATLEANANKSFQGSIVLGMGFTFDDTDREGIASPIAEMHRLIAKDARNAQRIFPYIGGEEVNDSPTHAHHRYVINFGEMTEDEARQWPELMAIVEEKVKPERMRLGNDADARRRKENWWLWGRYTPGLFAAMRGLDRVVVCARHQPNWCIAFMKPTSVFSEALIVFTLPWQTAFCALSSRTHEVWARFFGSSMKDDLRYTPSDCFETFPFPEQCRSHRELEAAGKEYYDFRAALMVRNNEGLTKTYNRFHDPNERSPDIVRLRELHAAMDRAVLDAYGWGDLRPGCEFLLDYEDEEGVGNRESGVGDEAMATPYSLLPTPSRRKKPWRYRWPDEVRDEVLARLLELNKRRADEERRASDDTPGGRRRR